MRWQTSIGERYWHSVKVISRPVLPRPGRIFASSQARAAIDYSWNGAALELDYWVCPRGSRLSEPASRFIYFASLPYTLGMQTQQVGYGPVNLAAFKFIAPEVQRDLPTY